MQTECCECDRPASRFIGSLAYCSRCASHELAYRGGRSHDCPKCGETQPAHVLWRRDAPCAKCQEKEKEKDADRSATDA